MTGLKPFYSEAEQHDEDYDYGDYHHNYQTRIQRKIMDGKTPYIDPRFFEAGGHTDEEEVLLAKIIQRCHEYDPNDRPSIFDIVLWLRRG